jgi:hypothetical protein
VPSPEKIAPEKVEVSKLYSLEFLQAVVASRLVSAFFYWTLTGEGVRTGGGFHTYPMTVRALPVPSPTAVARIVKDGKMKDVEQLTQRLAKITEEQVRQTSPSRIEQLKRQFDANDAALDIIFYQLYGLTKEEIALVEAATG